jgi:peptidoglycan/xylan/chitin deacetylase (PgdA/CDA1 family)
MNSKILLASSFQSLKISPLLLELQKRCIPGGYIRAINYHGTPADTADNFERQMAFYAEHYTPVSLMDLDMFFDRQRWDKERPGLIISFDDGLSSNYSVAAPLLEKYGFHGCFFVPVDFIAAPPSEQLCFSAVHGIVPDSTSLGADRVAMSWTELRDLDRRQHVIGCHTRSHLRMSPGLPDAVLEYEICTSKTAIEESLGHACECYCWVGGEEVSYTSNAARMIRKAGYKYSFTTNSFPITRSANPHRLERNNIEAVDSPALTSFQLCGFQDLRYAPKRRRVARTIQAQ